MKGLLMPDHPHSWFVGRATPSWSVPHVVAPAPDGAVSGKASVEPLIAAINAGTS
jgi:hypothetical protein